MNCIQAKQISLLHILNRQGFKEAYTRNNKGIIYYWFISPFRQTESKPSFSYNSQLNTFYDYGNGISGTVVDYICAYYQCEIPKALELLQDFNFSFSQQNLYSETIAEKKEKKSIGYGITSIHPIKHPALVQYLAKRKISPSLYSKYLVEINYTIDGRSFFGVGFQNASKGYEVSYEYKKKRTEEFVRIKTCLVCKDITFFLIGSTSVVVTESWSDFLALLTLYPKMEDRNDYIILNSVSMRDRLIEKIKSSNYLTIYSAADNDPAGSDILKVLVENFADRVIPLNPFYSDYKDVAEYLEKEGKSY
ncbi:toprim domain-containing protein [Sphingobacterium sp. PU5-4]|uniref:Toprim domain-containing protein n=1 Tax=Sphingobacterium tenebrionis TaxID=3111775 RepID=A0ABU8I589_9SPHI